MLCISAGKYWAAAVTSTGDVYMWDGKQGKQEAPSITRLHGVKRATSVSVGETHLLIVGSLYHPVYPQNLVNDPQKLNSKTSDEFDELDDNFMFNDLNSNKISSALPKGDFGNRVSPSLKSLCEKVAAEHLVEPRNAIQLLEIADSLGAHDLRKHCEVLPLLLFL